MKKGIVETLVELDGIDEAKAIEIFEKKSWG